MLAGACCRCLWPLSGGSSKFPGPPGENQDEEAEHLLDAVIESDDEQAAPLSSDQIRRYLDESKSRGFQGEESDEENSTTGWDSDQNARNRPSLLMGPGAYDELFEEELAESDDVVIGAKPWASGPSDLGSGSGSVVGSDAPPLPNASLSDWIDAADEPPPSRERPRSLPQTSTGALGGSSPPLSATGSGVGRAVGFFDKGPPAAGDFLPDFSDGSPRVPHGTTLQDRSPGGPCRSNGLPGGRREGDTSRSACE